MDLARAKNEALRSIYSLLNSAIINQRHNGTPKMSTSGSSKSVLKNCNIAHAL